MFLVIFNMYKAMFLKFGIQSELYHNNDCTSNYFSVCTEKEQPVAQKTQQTWQMK